MQVLKKLIRIRNSAILRLNSERQFVDVEPPYQRRGDIWTLEKANS